MLSVFLRWACQFGRNQSGAAMVIATIIIIPIILVATGVAVDYGQSLVLKRKLANAADAAAVAVATIPGLTQEEADAQADAFIRANFPELGSIGTYENASVVFTSEGIRVTTNGFVNATFLQVIGTERIDVQAVAEVVRGGRKVELVMVLDNTGSMCQPCSKINDLKAAATSAANLLFSGATEPDDVKIGLVPFSASVRIGTASLGSGWIENTGALGTLHHEDIDLVDAPGVNTLLDLYDEVQNRSWGGCVRARTNGYDLTDASPNVNPPASLWVPYFAPDTPDRDCDPVADSAPSCATGPSYPSSGNYLDDVVVGADTVQNRQRNVQKYINSSARRNRSPNYNCVTQTVQALTNNQTAITSAINNMGASGYTVIPTGLAWGWRVLSSSAPFAEGQPYSDQSVIKAIILLTDGVNQVGPAEIGSQGHINGHNNSVYSAYGFAASGHLGPPDGTQARQTLDSKTAALCNNIKADKDGDPDDDDILIYTITFQLNDIPTQNLMRNCATKPSMYFNLSEGQELTATFEEIASQLNSLRFVK